LRGFPDQRVNPDERFAACAPELQLSQAT
jgi:hypothetical protein